MTKINLIKDTDYLDITSWCFTSGCTTTEREKFTRKDFNDFIERVYYDGTHPSYHNISNNGLYRYAGIAYDFRPYLKRYVVKVYDGWFEIYAPNKTSVRRTVVGTVVEIYEIKNEHYKIKK